MIFSDNVHILYIYSALILLEQSNCIDWGNICNRLLLIEIKLFLVPCHMLLVELWETSCKFSSTANIKRGNSIVQFYNLIQNINDDGLMLFFCRINTILIQCLEIWSLYVFSVTLEKGWVNLTSIYNYMCNQCLSPLKLWGRIPLMARCTQYIIMW